MEKWANFYQTPWWVCVQQAGAHRSRRQKSRAALCERCTHGRHTTLDVNVTDEPMHGKMGHFLPDAMLEVVLADSTREHEQLVQRLLVACSGATTLAGLSLIHI